MDIHIKMKVTIDGCEHKAVREELERYITQENNLMCKNIEEYAKRLEVLYALCEMITEKGTSDEEIH